MIISFNYIRLMRTIVCAVAIVFLQACVQHPIAANSESFTHNPRNDAMNDATNETTNETTNDAPLPPNHNSTESPISAKRLPPPEINPIVLGEIHYTLSTSKNESHTNATTTLTATRDNDEILWHKAVYTIEFNPEVETDVQEVYVSSMVLNGNKDAIIIENELGARFTINIK